VRLGYKMNKAQLSQTATRMIYGFGCLFAAYFAFPMVTSITGMSIRPFDTSRIITENPIGTFLLVVWLLRAGKPISKKATSWMFSLGLAATLFCTLFYMKDQPVQSLPLTVQTLVFFGCGWMILPGLTHWLLSTFDAVDGQLLRVNEV
jgi:hypothetical protein